MNMKRMRGRNHRPGGGGGGGGGGGPIRHHNGQIPLNRNHVFDSNGPDLRIRGTAQQLFEKYLQLGRDATSSGDRVMAEGYFQYAEHYFRIVNAIAQAAQQNQTAQHQGVPQNSYANNQQRGRPLDEPDGDERGIEDPLISGMAQPPHAQLQQPQATPIYQPRAAERQFGEMRDAGGSREEERVPQEPLTGPVQPSAPPPADTPPERAAPDRPVEMRTPRERTPRQPRERKVVEAEVPAADGAPPQTELSGA